MHLLILLLTQAWAGGVPPLTPIRQATAQVLVYKRLTKDTTHTQSTDDTKICAFTHSLNVVDMRSYVDGYGGGPDWILGSCKTTLNGKPVGITVISMLTLMVGETGPLKQLYSGVTVTGLHRDSKVSHHGADGSAATTNLAETSLVTSLETLSDLPQSSTTYETIVVKVLADDAG